IGGDHQALKRPIEVDLPFLGGVTDPFERPAALAIARDKGAARKEAVGRSGALADFSVALVALGFADALHFVVVHYADRWDAGGGKPYPENDIGPGGCCSRLGPRRPGKRSRACQSAIPIGPGWSALSPARLQPCVCPHATGFGMRRSLEMACGNVSTLPVAQ